MIVDATVGVVEQKLNEYDPDCLMNSFQRGIDVMSVDFGLSVSDIFGLKASEFSYFTSGTFNDSNIVSVDCTFTNTDNSGIAIDGYTTGWTIDGIER